MSYRGRGRGGYYNNNSNNRNNYSNNNTNNNGGFPNAQNINQFISANSIPVEIYGWNGASMDDCVKFLSRKTRIAVTSASIDQITGALKGFVKSQKEADELCNWSGVKFAGQSLKILKSQNNSGGFAAAAPGGKQTTKTFEILAKFLRTRYDPNIKMLNLTAVQQDPTLIQDGFFRTANTGSKVFPALMAVAGELKLEVDSIDLSSNNLNDLSSVTTLPLTFPHLKNLALLSNNISRVKSFDTWKHKLIFLREIITMGNPFEHQTSPEDIKNEFMRLFPRLVVFNHNIIRNEAELNQNLTVMFTETKQMFFQDSEVQGLSTNFIGNFMGLWDSNRQGLMQLYQNESQFSVSVDMSHPHPFDNSTQTDFGYYLGSSRNLTKISTPKARASKVAVGPQQIYTAFTKLPKTKHQLMEKPALYSMEAYRIDQMNGIIINLHGSFHEVAQPENLEGLNSGPHNKGRYNRNKKIPLGVKSFDRSFIVIPGPNGSMIVASDALVIRNPSEGAEAWNVKNPISAPAAPPAPAIPGVPGVHNVPGAAPGALGAPGAPGAVAGGFGAQGSLGGPGAPGVPGLGTPAAHIAPELPPEVKQMLNPGQQEILVKVLLETRLNLQYGLMLCEQSNWDYNQCQMNFKNSAASLPSDAFA